MYIKGSQENIKAGRRQPKFKVKSSGQEKVVVIGGYASHLQCPQVCANMDAEDPAHSVQSRNCENTASTVASLSSPTKAFPSIEPNSPKL